MCQKIRLWARKNQVYIGGSEGTNKVQGLGGRSRLHPIRVCRTTGQRRLNGALLRRVGNVGHWASGVGVGVSPSIWSLQNVNYGDPLEFCRVNLGKVVEF